MIRQAIKDWITAKVIADALHSYAPDIGWSIMRTPKAGFWLVIHPQESSGADCAAIETMIGELIDQTKNRATDAR